MIRGVEESHNESPAEFSSRAERLLYTHARSRADSLLLLLAIAVFWLDHLSPDSSQSVGESLRRSSSNVPTIAIALRLARSFNSSIPITLFPPFNGKTVTSSMGAFPSLFCFLPVADGERILNKQKPAELPRRALCDPKNKMELK